MKRPPLVVGISVFVSVWFAFLCSENSLIPLSMAAALTSAIFFVLRNRRQWFFTACSALLAASAAFAGFFLYNVNFIEPVRALAGRNFVIEGLITDVDRGPSSTSYTMRVSLSDYPELPKNITVIMRSVGEIENGAGETIRLKARLLPAPDTIWYKSRGIYLTARDGRNVENAPVGRHRLERAVIRLRVIFERNLYAKLSERNADVVAVMALGMKSNIQPEIYTAVSRSGTAHLFSVSGLHLSILTGFVLAILRKLRCPEPITALITILICILFAATVGFSASVSRASAMTSIALSGKIFSRRGDSLNSLGLALLICTIIRPHWTISWGMWLSACSTAGIILFADKLAVLFYGRIKFGSTKIDRAVKATANGLAISVSAYAFTLPVLLMMSGWISLISPFANILVAPFIPFSIIGGIACALFPGTPFPLRIAAWLTDFSTSVIISVSGMLGGLPFSTIAADESWILIWLAGLCVFAVILITFKADKKLVSYALVLSVITFSTGNLSQIASSRDKLELITLMNRNSAVLLREDEAVILGTPDAYEISNLIKYLNFRGVKKIPAVIASDCGDNVGSGLLRLASAYKIDCVIGPNDAFIVDTLVKALPGSVVYSGGYAETGVLGGAKITTNLQNSEIYIIAGKSEIVKTVRECDIIENTNGRIEIYKNGTLLLPPGTPPAFEPLGAQLFGESRVLLDIKA